MADYALLHREAESKSRRALVTPEGVDLSLRLADAGQRISAFLLDLVFMMLILILATLGVALIAISGGWWQAAAIIWLLGFFVLRNCYFIIMEMGPRAATFGKRIVGTRVVARSGGRLTADAVIARNLMREIEFYLPLSFLAAGGAAGLAETATVLIGLAWTCIFLFFPLFNRDRLRVGDLLAGTWVISAPKRSLGFDLLASARPAARFAFTPEQLDAYGAFELQTLERVLRAGSPEALQTVADSIRAKINAWDNSSDAEFLNAYYEALRVHLERKLLFGKRRLDKHDR
jgi:uncharacterized RDD family membrane protein YckC